MSQLSTATTGGPEWRPRPGLGYCLYTDAQAGIPAPGRGALPDDRHLPVKMKAVIQGIRTVCRNDPKTPCCLSDAAIGTAAGLGNSEKSRRAAVQRILHGYTYWVDAAGERIRSLARHGDASKTQVRVPGAIELGFIVSRLDEYGRLARFVTLKYLNLELDPFVTLSVPTSAARAHLGHSESQGQSQPPDETADAVMDLGQISQDDVPKTYTADQLKTVLRAGDPSQFSRHECAVKIRTYFSDHGWPIVPKGGDLVVQPLSIDRPSDWELAILAAYRPEILALVNGKPKEPEHAPGRAARVGNQPEIRRLIAELPGRSDDAAACRLAELLADGFRDDDRARSIETYRGIAQSVSAGTMPQDSVQAAFEEACKAGVKNRGAAFVAAIRRLDPRRRPPS